MIDPLDSSDSTLRRIIWDALLRYSVDDLLLLLQDKDFIVRTAAAKILHLRSDRKIFEHAKWLCSDDDEALREIGAFVLGQLGTPRRPYRAESVGVVADLLRSDPSSSVRAAAAAAIGHLEGNEVSDLLLRATLDRSSDVRACAAFSLGRMRWSEEIDRALKRLKKSKVRNVRDWALLSIESLSVSG